MSKFSKDLKTILEMMGKVGESEIEKASIDKILETLVTLAKRIDDIEKKEKEDPQEVEGLLDLLRMARVTRLANKLIDILRTERQEIGFNALTIILLDANIRNNIEKKDFLDVLDRYWDDRVKEFEKDDDEGDEDDDE